MEAFLSNVTRGDILNVRLSLTSTDPVMVHRARVLNIDEGNDEGPLLVEMSNGEKRRVQWRDVEQRLKLPWKLESLRDYLIVLRRRGCRREDYVEDLKVRRNIIKNLLRLLTKKAHWRENQGGELLHAYYVGFDFMSDDEIDEMLPEDDVPNTLHIQYLRNKDWPTVFTAESFEEWLYEGRNNRGVAEALLHVWTHHLQTSDQDCIADFFHGLLNEIDDDDRADTTHTHLPLQALAAFVLKHCSLPFVLGATCTEDQIWENMQKIAEESSMVQAYLSVWKSSGSVSQLGETQVAEKLQNELDTIVYPWPEIKNSPTSERNEGRVAKAFPWTFPTGSGYLYHSRIRTDFTTAQWAQHVFRFYDGRALRSLRGHRVVWAIFNTVLREAAHQKKSLLHKQNKTSALTKKDLREMCDTRHDLAQKLSTFGAEIPTTSMHWKKQGNQLEWIVRHMSWAAPWTSTDKEDTKTQWLKKQNLKLILDA